MYIININNSSFNEIVRALFIREIYIMYEYAMIERDIRMHVSNKLIYERNSIKKFQFKLPLK